MGRNRRHSLPQMRLHSRTGHARVRINGTEHWLGRFGSPEAQAAYDRLIAEYLIQRSGGRQAKPATAPPPVAPEQAALPVKEPANSQPPVAPQPGLPSVPVPQEITVAELGVIYMDFAKNYYRLADGRLSSSYDGMLQAVNALRPFKRLPAASFGPRCLREIIDRLAHAKNSRGKPWPRKSINRLVKRIRSLFKWAVSMEMVPASTWHSLMAVEGLKRGRTSAPELPPVREVPDEIVNKTLPLLPKTVADLVRFIRHTGCRPGEACLLRPADIERVGPVWKWTLTSHKNAWRDQDRVIMLGPRVQKIISPYLKRLEKTPQAYCFSPKASEQQRNAIRKASRQSPMTPSQAARRPKSFRERRRPTRDHYTDESLNRCIRRACEKAEISRWTPMQLRHTAGTEARKAGGSLDAAQVRLGHKHAKITEVYAELNQAKAAELALKLG
jgi:integrase